MPAESTPPDTSAEVTVEADGPDIEIEVDDDSPDGADTESAEEWTPPTREEWEGKEALLKKLRKYERAEKRGQPVEADGESPDDVATRAYAEAESKFKPIIVKQAARAAFAEAGLILPKEKDRQDSAVGRALKLLDMDDIVLGEDGSVDGLADQIADIKADYPELFAKKTVSRVDGAERGRPTPAAKSSAQRLAGLIS